MNFDGFVKSPSVLLRAGLRFMRSLRGKAHQGPHSSVFARLASGAFYETIVWLSFYEIIKFNNAVITLTPHEASPRA